MMSGGSLRARGRSASAWPLKLAGVLLVLAGGSVQAGLFEDDEARRYMLDLNARVEAQRKALNQQLADEVRKLEAENAQLRRSLLDLQGQIDVVRADLARMRGQDEQLAREFAEMQRRQKDLTQGMDDRLRQVEPLQVNLDGRSFSALPAEKRDFDAALAAFRGGDFAGAQSLFVGFLKRFPQGGYAPSALFWLGNAQYATRHYKESVTNFREMLELAPDHPRAPEALLSIANCQIELKDRRAARKTLEDLLKFHPQSEAAIAARDRLAALR